jgi:hypothetical protein
MRKPADPAAACVALAAFAAAFGMSFQALEKVSLPIQQGCSAGANPQDTLSQLYANVLLTSRAA